MFHSRLNGRLIIIVKKQTNSAINHIFTQSDLKHKKELPQEKTTGVLLEYFAGD